MGKMQRELADPAATVDAVRKSGHGQVKVAVADIDGILRGKYIHARKFASALAALTYEMPTQTLTTGLSRLSKPT